MTYDVQTLGTHFHIGEVVVYELSKGCPYEYIDGHECPACGYKHRCGDGCE